MMNLLKFCISQTKRFGRNTNYNLPIDARQCQLTTHPHAGAFLPVLVSASPNALSADA